MKARVVGGVIALGLIAFSIMLTLTDFVFEQSLSVGVRIGLVSIAIIVLAALYGAFRSRQDPRFRSSYDMNPRRNNRGIARVAGAWAVLGAMGLMAGEKTIGVSALIVALLTILMLVARRK